jgi:hypothetical protein
VLLTRARHEVVGGAEDDAHERTNDRIIEIARAIDDRPHALIV